jgi:hypothetical protein
MNDMIDMNDMNDMNDMHPVEGDMSGRLEGKVSS